MNFKALRSDQQIFLLEPNEDIEPPSEKADFYLPHNATMIKNPFNSSLYNAELSSIGDISMRFIDTKSIGTGSILNKSFKKQ